MSYDAPWKRAERIVARLFGGHRRVRHIGGPDEGDPGDVVDGPMELIVDTKYRKTHAAFGWWRDLKVKGKGRIPVVVLREHRSATTLLVIEADKTILEKVQKALDAARNP